MSSMRPVPAPSALLWLVALLGFAFLVGFAAAYDTFPADVWLAHRLQEIDAGAFVRAVDWAEDLADAPAVIAIWLAAVVALFARAQPWGASLLLISMAARLLNSGLKELIERPRPLDYESATSSFPSGHASGALILYGLIFYFASLFIPYAPVRVLVQAACLWVILFTGLERVYVGAHWPSDVLGGYYFGALVLAVLIAAHRSLIRPR